MVELICTLIVAVSGMGCGWYVRGVFEQDRRDAKRHAKWQGKWVR